MLDRSCPLWEKENILFSGAGVLLSLFFWKPLSPFPCSWGTLFLKELIFCLGGVMLSHKIRVWARVAFVQVTSMTWVINVWSVTSCPLLKMCIYLFYFFLYLTNFVRLLKASRSVLASLGKFALLWLHVPRYNYFLWVLCQFNQSNSDLFGIQFFPQTAEWGHNSVVELHLYS